MTEGAGWGDTAGGTHTLGPCVTVTVVPSIQCPALVALGINLLGTVLSFTCIPANTKGAGARAQAAPPGKPRQVCCAGMLASGGVSPPLPPACTGTSGQASATGALLQGQPVPKRPQ